MTEYHAPGPLMSLATIHNGTAILSGQVALSNPQADLATQAHEVFERIDTILSEIGSSRERLLSATIWLVDPADFSAFNALWTEWLGTAPRPARATVCTALVLPGLKIEIQVSAAVDA